MKKQIYFILISYLVCSICALSQQATHSDFNKVRILNENYFKSLNEFKSLYHKDVDELFKYKHFNRWNQVWGERINSEGKIDLKEILQEIEKQKSKEKNNKLLSSNISWEAIGPHNSPVNDEGLGRVNVVKLHPNNSSIVYVGTASGGAWVSKDNCKTWNILPTTDYLSLAISDIEISKSNPNTIYISTSDANGANSVSGTVYGIGVLKSTDGGKSFFPTKAFYNLDANVLTTAIALHPEDENILWVATSNGIIKSTDGGNSYISYGPKTFVKDIEIHPTNSNILYISTNDRYNYNSKVYKSEDSGENWKLVQSYGESVRTELAITPSLPDRVVSLVSQNFPYSFHSVNLSDDAGETWKKMSDSTNPNILGRNHGSYPAQNTSVADQGWYDLCIAINPKSPKEIITGGIWLWQSENSGAEFNEIVDSYHVDQHYLEYTPSGDTVYIGNDGGLYRYVPILNLIEFAGNGMNITQYYKLSVNNQNTNMIIAGSQDNNSMLKRANGNWYNVRSGDGMDCHFDPKDPNYVYASSQYGNFGYSTNNGTNFRQSISQYTTKGEEGAWVTPFAVDPQKVGYVYVGYYNIWVNKNHGKSDTWEKLTNFGTSSPLKILTIAESNSDYIYCSEGGSIRFTTNGGQNWDLITNPGGKVSDIEVNPTNPKKIYVSVSNYTSGMKVFEYELNTKVWKNISGNLPNIPINTIKFQKNSPDRIFVGTDIGVYFTDYNSRYWERYGKNLPYTIVNDIDIIENENKIFIASYGRGIWAADLINCNYAPLTIVAEGETSFCDGDSTKLVYKGSYNSPDEILWSTGEIGTSIWVKKKGSYSVARKVTDNCYAKSNYIEINPISTINIIVNSSRGDSLCVGDSTKLTAGFGQKEYVWNDGTKGLTKWVYEPGTYSVRVLNANGCYSYDTINIYQKILEKPTITINDSVLSVETSKFVQWYYNGNYVEGANSNTFVPEGDGEVFVEIRDGFCKAFSETFIYTYNSIFQDRNIKIYPNPVNNVLKIDVLNDNVISDIKIFNLKGEQVVSESRIIKNRIELNLQNLINGVYILNLKVNGKELSTKINVVK